MLRCRDAVRVNEMKHLFVLLAAGMSFVGTSDTPRCEAAMTSQPSADHKVIRNRLGHKLGEIIRLPDGRFVARDALGRKLGVYNPKSDQTRDALDRLLTKGNTLPALIMKAADTRKENR